MRWSWPMPRRTSLMSAPSRSHRFAISLMKLIFVASMALATYLVISADSGDMTRNGRSVRRNGAYSSRSTSPTSGRRTPTTTRSGFMKSSIAAPSFRNSGIAGDIDVRSSPSPRAARRPSRWCRPGRCS